MGKKREREGDNESKDERADKMEQDNSSDDDVSEPLPASPSAFSSCEATLVRGPECRG